MGAAPDPYQTLGVSRSASDAELRAAYRRLVQRHHPDHNGGSAESARRFEDVQDAYAQVRKLRPQPHVGPVGSGPQPAAGAASRAGAKPAADTGSPAGTDPGLESRLAELERELKAALAAEAEARQSARVAREQALRDAREAFTGKSGEPRSDEELGYISTDDSFSKIFADAASDLSQRLSDTRESPAGRRLSELIDELGSKLTGEPPDR